MEEYKFRIIIENKIGSEISKRLKSRGHVLDWCDTKFQQNGYGDIAFITRAHLFREEPKYLVAGVLSETGDILEMDLVDEDKKMV